MMRFFLIGCLLISHSASGQYFTDVAQQSGISFVTDPLSMMGGGAAWFDYDNDGWEDLYITGSTLMDRLYRNLGDGSFEDVSMDAGLFETANNNTLGVAIGDYNNDGNRDILITTWRELNGPTYARNLLYLNEGDGTFTEVGEQAGLFEPAFSMAAAFLDVNLDGWLDIYIGNYVATAEFVIEDGQPVGFNHTCFEDRFYINNQDGTFAEMSEIFGTNNEGCALAVVASDYDLDGDLDLMVANDFGSWVVPNKLYNNSYPAEGLTDQSEISGADIGIYGMGIAVGDYDEDLDLDYYITNIGRNVLLNNNGGVFTDVSTEAQVENEMADDLFYTSWATFFMDYDNDSWLDLFVCNGHIPTIDILDNHEADPNKLYENNGDGTFSDISEASGLDNVQIARGAAMADYDKDGDLDVAVVNLDNNVLINDDPFMLFQNNASQGNWVAYSLQGVTCNRDAIGALVTLHAGGRTFIQELSGGGGPHNSHNSSLIHFGLGEMSSVDSVFVQWPGGASEHFDSEINDCFILEQGLGLFVKAPSRELYIGIYPVPSSDQITVLLGAITKGKFQVIDNQGKEVLSGPLPVQVQWKLQVGALSPGMYTLLILDENGTTRHRKFVKD